jgi:hypothetical protein
VSGPYRRNRLGDPALPADPPRPTGAPDADTNAEGRLTPAVYAASRSPARRLSALIDTILAPSPSESTTPLTAAADDRVRPPLAVTAAVAAAGPGTHAEQSESRPRPTRPPA